MAEKNDIYSVARVRVKEKYLLTDADIEQLLTQKDQEAMLAFLRDKGWGSDGAGAAAMLSAEEKKAMADFAELCPDPSVLEVLSYPELYHNLKTGIKEICTEGQHPGAFYEGTEYGREEMLQILRDKAYEKLPEHMRSAAANAYETMMQTMDGQMCDVIADRACIESMLKDADASGHDILKEYTQQLAAAADIRIALRASRTGKSINFLRAALIPCSSFDVGRLAIAAADSPEALISYLEANGMAGAGEALKQSDHAFEKWCDDRIMEMVSPHRRTFCGVGPVVAYYFARKSEIKTVRMILTARANGLAEKDIRERVRRAYV